MKNATVFTAVAICCVLNVACHSPHRTTLGEGDENPRARIEWETERLCDPKTGLIPEASRQKELRFVATLDAQERAFKHGGASSAPLVWNQRGPYNIGGRTRAIQFDITNDQIIMAASVAGGVWRSEDQGNSWKKISTPNELQNVTTIVQDPRPGHTSTWYYGTGEHDGSAFNGERYSGDGLYKSVDGGLTWNPLTATVSGTPQTPDQPFDYVFRLAVDSSSTTQDVVYAAATKGVLRSSDGGTTWKLVLGAFDLKTPAQFTDVAVASDGSIYAALSSGSAQWSGIWRSPDGVTWTRIDVSQVAKVTSAYGRIVIALAPTNKHLAYFFVDNTNSSSLLKYEYLSGTGAGSAGTWTRRDANLPGIQALPGLGGLNTQQGYAMTLAVHPSDENTLYIGGSNLYRSTDGFATKSNVTWIGGYLPNALPDQHLHIQYEYPNHHPDIQALAFSPKNSAVMVSGTDGGVEITKDDRASEVAWQSLDRGYLTSEFYGIAIDHGTTGDAMVMGGMQDNGTCISNTLTSTTPWTEMRGDDGSYCAIADHGASVYVSTQNGKLYRGQIDQNLQAAGWGFASPDATGFLFVTPWVMDPNHNERMYMAVDQEIWRETDITRVALGTTTSDPNWEDLTQTNCGTGHLTAVAVSSQPANIIYYGTNDGHVFRLDSSNTSEAPGVDVSGSNFPSGYVARIAIDPHDAKSALVVFSNYNIPSVFYTSNGGSTWKDVSGSLEQFPDGHGDGPSCRGACILHRGPATSFYIGTSVGLFSATSLDGSNIQWHHESPDQIGTEIVEMIDARESDGYIAVATYGEGIFTSNVPLSGVSATPLSSSLITQAQTYPNPARLGTTLSFILSRPVAVVTCVYDVTGKLMTLSKASFSTGANTIPLVTRDLPAGSYRYVLEASEAKVSGVFTVIK